MDITWVALNATGFTKILKCLLATSKHAYVVVVHIWGLEALSESVGVPLQVLVVLDQLVGREYFMCSGVAEGEEEGEAR